MNIGQTSFALLADCEQSDRRAVVLNCSEASERYPFKLLSDWGQSLYDLASPIEPQTGGLREAPADEEFGGLSLSRIKPEGRKRGKSPFRTPFRPASLANFTG